MPSNFCFFKKKKYIYIYLGWGEGKICFSLVLIKLGCGEFFFKCYTPGLSHLGQIYKWGDVLPGWGHLPYPHPRELPSLWLLPLFYEELRCYNFLEPQFFGFLFG